MALLLRAGDLSFSPVPLRELRLTVPHSPFSARKPDQLMTLIHASPLGRCLLEVQQQSGVALYLVGGCVRDWLLGKEPLDWDVVVPAATRSVLASLKDLLKPRAVIELDAQLEIFRLQFEADTYLDLARLAQDNLFVDLQRRDLSINAMALDLQTGLLIDPLNGYTDLLSRKIRIPSLQNLSDDPVRVLRAFRFAATLNFDLVPEAQAWLQVSAPLMERVAGERLLAEWHKLLVSGRAAATLRTMQRLEILAPALGAPLQETASALRRVGRMENILHEISSPEQPRLSKEIYSDVDKERPLQATYLFAALLLRATRDNLAATLRRLPFSRRQVQLLRSILHGYEVLQTHKKAALSPLEIFRAWRDHRTAWPGLMWCLLGDPSLVLRALGYTGLKSHWELCDNPLPRLISGNDILELPGVEPGPHIAHWLTTVDEAIAMKQVKSRQEALDLLHHLRADNT